MIVKQQYHYYLVAFFGIFLGSQITEGILLIPYWQSLEASDFYGYYGEFGPSIGRFYTVLTIIAALIPIFFSIYLYKSKSKGLFYSLISTVFALLFVACFYVYFKGVNESFYASDYTSAELNQELIIWNRWHWSRVLLELISLLFLIFAINKDRRDIN